jgi:hypothetical protein
MKCFTHPEVDAVGFCRVCGRALCRDCVAEVSSLCCCRARCEPSVKTYFEEATQNRAKIEALGQQYLSVVFRFIVTVGAILLLLIGFIAKASHDDANTLGNLLILVAVILLARSFYLRFIVKPKKQEIPKP